MRVGRILRWFRTSLALLGLAMGDSSADAALPAAEAGHAEAPLTALDRSHWAFRPVTRPQAPGVATPAWCRTPVDQFIWLELQRRGLEPMPEAERATLLRRVTFDLTGLPPTVAEQAAFFADRSPDAYERVVDRLLSSPAFGERWALPWLDLVRFAETDGFEHDKVRPEAWRYRDWVIAAFNCDLPYDRFVALQLAADEIAPDDLEAQLATGYLLAGPDMPDINLQEERRHVFLNGMTANVGEVLLGLQFGCCQCHDHKADPLSQYDFYRLRACFETIDLFQDRALELPAEGSGPRRSVAVRATRPLARAPEPSRLWIRGDFRRPGPVVPPAVPRVATREGTTAELAAANDQRRAQLAAWMTSPENPLVARVIVNRLWQQHFGVGLVATPSDFGLMGREPTHPELLDWLAAELIDAGWSLKHLHRLLVTSAVYRTRSHPSPVTDGGPDPVWTRLREADPANVWLGRMRRRRLEGETLRDTMLAVSDTLNRAAGGPGVRPPLPAEVVATLLKDQWPVTADTAEHRRRSIYLFVRRNLKYPLFEVFDRPDQNLSCSRRQQSTTPLQTLTLFNSEFSREAAAAIVSRLDAAGIVEPRERVLEVYRWLFAREASDAELAAASMLLAQSGPDGWTDLLLALLNTNEFLYID